MKKAKIIAAVVMAAAVSATTFAACGSDSGKKFKLDDYAHALDSAYSLNYRSDYKDDYAHDSFKSIKKKNYSSLTPLGNTFFKAAVPAKYGNTDATQTTYAFYDINNDKELYRGLCSIDSNSVSYYYYGYYTLNYYTLISEKKVLGETVYEYKYAGPDGSLLTDQVFTEESASYKSNHSLSLQHYVFMVDENGNAKNYFQLKYSYTHNEDVKEVEKYFSLSLEKHGETVWKEIDKEDIGSGDYDVGKQLGVKKYKIGNPEIYPSKNDGYEFSVESPENSDFKTYTFYKDDKVLSSVTVEDTAVYFVGDYLYYCSIESVSSDATAGYNYEYKSGDNIVKENHTLYRYNYVKGANESEVVNTDYIITGYEGSLYNYKNKKFDKWVVTAYKKVNGVVVKGSFTKEYTLILDDNCNLALDVSGRDLASSTVFKLKDNRYLTYGYENSYIVDGNFNTVASLPGRAEIWAEQDLISCGKSNNIIVDYDGKVVIQPISSKVFYGGVAYSGGKLYSLDNPKGLKVEELISIDEKKGETVKYNNGLLLKVTPHNYEWNDGLGVNSRAYYNVCIYNLSGNQLGAIDNLVSDSMISIVPFGGKLLVNAYVYGDLTEGVPEVNYWVVL